MDCDRFRFVGAWREVKRYKVIIKASSTGHMIQNGYATIEKIKRDMDKYPAATFTFYYNTGECIIEVPFYCICEMNNYIE